MSRLADRLARSDAGISLAGKRNLMYSKKLLSSHMVVCLYESTVSPGKQAWSRDFGQTQDAGKQACFIVPRREERVHTRAQKSVEMFTITPAIALEMFCHYTVYSHLCEQNTKDMVLTTLLKKKPGSKCLAFL